MGWDLGYGIWDGIWDMGYGMGFGIWDMGWDLGFGIWNGIWDLGYGMGFGIWDWDMGVWDWNMTPMGFGIFPNPTVWVASIVGILKKNDLYLSWFFCFAIFSEYLNTN